MAKQITEITKRDLREMLENVDWWGRLEETEFLSRLYSIDELPSHHGRYKTAEQDIWQHRINNGDWSNDWIFSDDRFSLSDGQDEDLLRFLTEMLHPAVRKESDSETLLERINPLLRADGYEIIPNGAISGRPTYGWRRVSVAATPHRHFTKDIQPLVSTVSELARQDGDELEQAVLQQATANVQPGSIHQGISWSLERPLSAVESLDIGVRPTVGAALA